MNKFKTEYLRLNISIDEMTLGDRYHYFEVYDPTKLYNTDMFEEDYGFGKLKYQYTLIRYKGTDKKYVVAEEIIDEHELEKLRKYCRCDYHMQSTLGLWLSYLYIWPSVSKKCEFPTYCEKMDGSYNQHIIDRTREYVKLYYNK